MYSESAKLVSCNDEDLAAVAEGWTFLTNHALVLLCVARDPDVRIRTVADCAGITERAAQRIMSELVEAGYLTRHRLGRRNFYEVHAELAMRHPLEAEHQVGELLKALVSRASQRPGDARRLEGARE